MRLPTALALAVACSISFTACGSSHDARLEPLARATLEPGVGLGDVHLGETTLGAFVDRFGAGSTSLIASDQIGFELVFEHGQIAFLFLYDVAPRADEEYQAMRRATRDMSAFLAGDPKRREIKLASLSVRAGDELDSTFYRGKLAQGVALLDPFLISAGRVGVPNDGPGSLLAGMSPNLPSEKAVFADRGLVLYGEREPKPDQPSRLTRMTVFLPEKP